MTATGFDRHDHHSCISASICAADLYCSEHRLRFTPVRRRVLEILLTKHEALGAYDILQVLASEGLGSQPPVVYRALDFLVKYGFVHKIERLNAFIACMHPGQNHTPSFLICRKCHAIAETVSDPDKGRLARAAEAAGFEIERTVLEAEGVCPLCAGSSK